MSLTSKRIIITGGARGIGRAVVLAYAKEGAIVTSMDVLDDLGSKTAAEANALGAGTVSYAHVDIGDRDSVKKAFEEAAERMGGLDVMVNAAGRLLSRLCICIRGWRESGETGERTGMGGDKDVRNCAD
jgi:3-oxoacyl-[acyl-carrier protein] reductase